MKKPPQSDDPVRDLIQVARDLRDKNGGCPWDLEQTHASLAKHLVEEASELVEVIEQPVLSDDAFKEELGDVLFQVVIHAQLASESGRFDFSDVARGIAAKLIHRHPHVYGDVTATDSTEVLKNWEAIKARERAKKQERTSYLDGVPKNLAALQRAARLGEKASRIGFDWPEDTEVPGLAEPGMASGKLGGALQQIRDKVSEELAELDEAVKESPERAREELGDLLFVLAQYARRLDIDPEGALRQACHKFESRFRAMEAEAAPPHSAAEWDILWNKAKDKERLTLTGKE